jgi:hypothetical protein
MPRPYLGTPGRDERTSVGTRPLPTTWLGGAEGILNGTPNEFTTFNGVPVPVKAQFLWSAAYSFAGLMCTHCKVNVHTWTLACVS